VRLTRGDDREGGETGRRRAGRTRLVLATFVVVALGVGACVVGGRGDRDEASPAAHTTPTRARGPATSGSPKTTTTASPTTNAPTAAPATSEAATPSTTAGVPPRPAGSADRRGPIGRDCPHTPTYTTAATHHADAASLQSVLDSITVSDASHPAVIETTGLPAQLSGGSAGWDRNVLIRPPLGSFLPSTGGIDTSAAAVTIAGFNFTGNIRTEEPAHRQWYMWSTVEPTATILPTGADQAGLCEVVFPERGREGDTVQIKGSEQDPPVGYHLIGVWLQGKDRAPDSDVHADAVQQTTCVDCVIEDSVVFGSIFALIASNDQGEQSGLTVENTWMDGGSSMSAMIKSPGLRLIDNDFVGTVALRLEGDGGAAEIRGNHFGGDFTSLTTSDLSSVWPDNVYGGDVPPAPEPDLSVWR
jgi:hypothetical protein